mmetsp:Transcript_3192/g.9810  ORF Transcript_3192/g.9810 Transcript_3192/m.9810 type:complete len:87 (-) Transcript_3192:13-273(-)
MRGAAAAAARILRSMRRVGAFLRCCSFVWRSMRLVGASLLLSRREWLQGVGCMNGGSAILPTENVRELPSVTKSIPEQRIAMDYAV